MDCAPTVNSQMTDDRWNLKGSDEEVIKRFRETKREYDEQRDERVTNDRALELLMDGVPIERDSDTDAILNRLERVEDVLNDLDDDVASDVIAALRRNGR